MTKCLLITCVFDPEPVVSARTSFDIANFLSKEGNSVTVVAPIPSRPSGKIYKGYISRMFAFNQKSSLDKFRIVRLLSFPSPKSSLISRLLENLSFGFCSSIYLLFRSHRYDVIYLNTWPLFATAMNVWVAKLFDIPVVRSIQDVYPATLLSQERAASDSFLMRVLTKLEKFNYRHSYNNIVISQELADKYADMLNGRVGGLKAPVVIPNWGDLSDIPELSEVSHDEIPSHLKMLKDWAKSDTLVLFGGNFSKSAATPLLVEVFNKSNIRQTDIKLLLAGSGAEMSDCQNLIEKYDLQDTVRILSPWETNDTQYILNLADIFVLPTLGEQALNSVPSKVLNYLRYGKPILAIAPSESSVSNIIQESNSGVCLPTFDLETMARELIALQQLDSTDRVKLGRNGRNYFINHFASSKNLERLCRLVVGAGRLDT
jgi:glycosyltransferase involved in cell wall biosynthesis